MWLDSKHKRRLNPSPSYTRDTDCQLCCSLWEELGTSWSDWSGVISTYQKHTEQLARSIYKQLSFVPSKAVEFASLETFRSWLDMTLWSSSGCPYLNTVWTRWTQRSFLTSALLWFYVFSMYSFNSTSFFSFLFFFFNIRRASKIGYMYKALLKTYLLNISLFLQL